MSSAIQFGKTRNIRADYIQDLLITLKFMEITEEMLDVIEKVKGSRNPGLWDPRCQQYFDKKGKSELQKPVKLDSTS